MRHCFVRCIFVRRCFLLSSISSEFTNVLNNVTRIKHDDADGPQKMSGVVLYSITRSTEEDTQDFGQGILSNLSSDLSFMQKWICPSTNGFVLQVGCSDFNLAHSFLERFWPGFSILYSYPDPGKLVLFCKTQWYVELWQIVAKEKGWTFLYVLNAAAGNTVGCPEGNVSYELSKFWTPLRITSSRVDKNLDSTSQKLWLRDTVLRNLGIFRQADGQINVTLYTREDAQHRRIEGDVAVIVNLFKDWKPSPRLQVVKKMPADFISQVALFSQTDILIAPNGVWVPNVMFMKAAVILELHLFRVDSWLNQFGMTPDDCSVVTITGNFTHAGAPFRPGRIGGDGIIVIDNRLEEALRGPISAELADFGLTRYADGQG